MSTFKGKMLEYRFLSIDRFDDENLAATRAFFLSHCHSDHMEGLDSRAFVEYLKISGSKLYTHEITMRLLMFDTRYIHLENFITPLKTFTPYNIDSAPPNSVMVTLLPAGHCPGSVMFFFEGDQGNVLYTGDIRICKSDLEQMAPFFYESSLKSIKSVYFDSTFCLKSTINIPDRKISRDLIVQFSREWLARSQKRKIFLYCAAKYGQEYLICQLSEALRTKIHVSKAKYRIYEKIPEIFDHVTHDAIETKIHACSHWENELENDCKNVPKTKKSSSCPDCHHFDPNVLVIRPSMMWFARIKSARDKLYTKDGNYLRVKYSSHSSLDEIRQLLAFLKPQNAYPNVIAANQSIEKIYQLISDLLPYENSRDDQVRKMSYQQGASSTTNFQNLTLSLQNRYNLTPDDNGKISTKFQCRYSYVDGKSPGLEELNYSFSEEEEENSKIDYNSDQDIFNISR